MKIATATDLRPMRLLVSAALIIALAVVWPAPASTAVTPPTGLTAYAVDGNVSLAWQSAGTGATYAVYRGTSATSITTVVSPLVNATTYTDSTVNNGTTYYYAVKANPDSALSAPVSAKPTAASCSSTNVIVRENCFPGDTGWKVSAPADVAKGGIEGFATKTSVNLGQSVDLKISTASQGAPYRVDVYRTGWYGGTQGRLVSSLVSRSGDAQPSCNTDSSNWGLIDCSNWTSSLTLTTSTSWTTGVYLLKITRTDNNTANHILLVVRNDASNSDALYDVPVSSYQAYNNYGGRSLYDWNSWANGNTVSGTTRAVKVSFDRPYHNSVDTTRNWYPYGDIEAVSWLERQGYNLSYDTSLDLTGLTTHKTFISGVHDEYWSAGMRTAAKSARDAGTSLVFLGANDIYWKIRYEASPFSGVANRVQTCYKSTQSGGPDPSGIPTGTWRDPAGANDPENALLGTMYVGDNDGGYFPMQISANESKNRVWRYSSIYNTTGGNVGSQLIGWEWDKRFANGKEPPGVTTVASSAASGEILTDAGKVYQPGSAVVTSTTYQAASGAWVFSAATNHWSRGLAVNTDGVGEPNSIIQQATANILSDGGSRPATPSGVTIDPVGPPTVSSTTPADGATGVSSSTTVKATFNQSLDASTVTPASFTLTGPGGTAIAASVSYDDATKTATLTPSAALDSVTTYTAKLSTQIKGANGVALASAVTWSFTTAGGTPPTVTARTPAAGATGVSTATAVTATFDRALTASSVTSSSFTLKDAGGTAVPASVSYDATARKATLTPSASLTNSTQYTATLTTAIKASDGTPMAAADSWSFTTHAALSITSRWPAPLATGISPSAAVRVTFSRAVDAATLTSQTFTLAAGGPAVPATISYDPATTTATLTPSQPLATLTSYTATVTTGVKATDGESLGSAVSWSFTTASTQPAAPSPTTLAPTSGAVGVPLTSTVRATFDRSLDPATINGQSFVLRNSGGTVVAANVTYDDASRTATLTPSAAFVPGAQYTAQLTTAIRSTDGTPLASNVSWSFTAADCPCQLMTGLTPGYTGAGTQDGRTGSGPFTYELGTKIAVDQTMTLVALRFYKDAAETGTHVGRVWSSGGTQLASATFANETASGWQRQALVTPLTLQPGQTYTLSVGINKFFVGTTSGLATQLTTGPLHTVADGANGVFNGAAGNFPSSSWNSTNYFVDAIVRSPSSSQAPQVVSQTPTDGATGVAVNTSVKATFNRSLDPSTVSSQSFTLKNGAGTTVAAAVSYDDATKTVTLNPSSSLATAGTYTARLGTEIRSDDETPLASAVSWTFSTVSAAAPAVTSTSPTAGATNITTSTAVQATFSQAMDPATINNSSFTLTAPGAAAVPASVSYDGATSTATLTPSSALSASTTYTATVTTAARAAGGGAALGSAVSWTFTTSACPCTLFASSLTPATTGLSTQDGRSGSGPWPLELGVKIRVTQPAQLTAIRFWRDPGETGTHIGRVWSATGTLITQTTFSGETASGWQQQALATPLALTPGQTYVVAVGFNTRWALTGGGLASQITSGPLQSVADGANGVYTYTGGAFPTGSYNNANYFVDASVR